LDYRKAIYEFAIGWLGEREQIIEKW